MAGMPIRRARREAAEFAKQTALRGGEEPLQPHQVDNYTRLTNPPPVRHPRKPRQPRTVAPANVPRPAAGPSLAISEADAAIFQEARGLALANTLAFIKQDFSQEPDPSIRAKMQLKQQEMCQSILMLGGRIDPGSFKGAGKDEVAEMLEKIKTGQPQT